MKDKPYYIGIYTTDKSNDGIIKVIRSQPTYAIIGRFSGFEISKEVAIIIKLKYNVALIESEKFIHLRLGINLINLANILTELNHNG